MCDVFNNVSLLSSYILLLYGDQRGGRMNTTSGTEWTHKPNTFRKKKHKYKLFEKMCKHPSNHRNEV